MGICRDAGSTEIDIVKEMAEGLGSTGLKLEDILEKANATRENVVRAVQLHQEGGQDITDVNESITQYNRLIDQAEDTLKWLLIQREACGFRTHRNVNVYYPIPSKLKLLK